jgi:hypothetical protein
MYHSRCLYKNDDGSVTRRKSKLSYDTRYKYLVLVYTSLGPVGAWQNRCKLLLFCTNNVPGTWLCGFLLQSHDKDSEVGKTISKHLKIYWLVLKDATNTSERSDEMAKTRFLDLSRCD